MAKRSALDQTLLVKWRHFPIHFWLVMNWERTLRQQLVDVVIDDGMANQDQVGDNISQNNNLKPSGGFFT